MVLDGFIRDRPWLGVAYVRAVLSGSGLWVKCTSSAESENPFEWPCPRYRIGYGVDITPRARCLEMRYASG
jgi:hypothetical protein